MMHEFANFISCEIVLQYCHNMFKQEDAPYIQARFILTIRGTSIFLLCSVQKNIWQALHF